MLIIYWVVSQLLLNHLFFRFLGEEGILIKVQFLIYFLIRVQFSSQFYDQGLVFYFIIKINRVISRMMHFIDAKIDLQYNKLVEFNNSIFWLCVNTEFCPEFNKAVLEIRVLSNRWGRDLDSGVNGSWIVGIEVDGVFDV